MSQKLIPGLIGLSTHTDCAYLRIMHSVTACPDEGGGSVSRLKLLLRSLDFAQLIEHSRAGRWEQAEMQIADAAEALQRGGADFLLICANTAYALTGRARSRVDLPILDIAAPVCRAIRAAGLSAAGLLSTLKTSESGVYQAQADGQHLRLLPPPPSIAEAMQALILDELVGGRVTDNGLTIVRSAVAWFARQGADCVILGCTDLTHLVERLNETGGTDLPLFDSTCLHAAAAAEAAMSGQLQAPWRRALKG